MHPMPQLSPLLKQLRLSGILDSLEARNKEAVQAKLAYTDFLALLIQDEVARREQKKFNMRVRRAGFRSHKTIEQFDFGFIPKLNQTLIQDLATCRFVTERANVLIAGPCGTGKSHLAQALGHCAVRSGHEVLFACSGAGGQIIVEERMQSNTTLSPFRAERIPPACRGLGLTR